jgi:hypothetical protein
MDMSNSGSLFEFVEPDGNKPWVATPGKQTTFPLSIRNETAEGHDIAVLVEDPANWAWAEPQRVNLDPGDSATVSIVFAPHKETTIAAGVHQAAIRLRDLEGVIFAEHIRPFEVEERQELAMTLTLRGPLMSFGMAEGFVLHCTLANRGNIDVKVTPAGDPHPTLTFSERTVSVPFQGEVAFDIEVRWNAARRNNHPELVTLRAPYKDGQASASIDWHRIAEALEPFMPIYSTVEEEDEFLSLSWLPAPGEDVLERRIPQIASVEAGAEPADNGDATPTLVGPAAHSVSQSASEPAPLSSPPPHPLLAARRGTPSKRINPWWPILQKIGGRWRLKPLPIMMLIIAMEGYFLGMTQAQRDFYASPELQRPVPKITRAFKLGSQAAQTLVGYGRHALSVTLNEGSKLEHSIHFGQRAPGGATIGAPTLWGLSAHYRNPHLLSISFNETGCSALELIVASGTTVIYDKPIASEQASVPIPSGLTDPLRITVVGTAPGGIELRQHVFMALPFAH